MRLTVLGSGTCVPYPRRGPAGYFVATSGGSLLVDSGSGTLGRLVQAGLDYRHLEAALYTHTHPDHIADLAPLLFALNYTPGFERDRPLTLAGPPGLEAFVAGLTALQPGIAPRGYPLVLWETDDEAPDLASGRVLALPVEHAGIPAVAYRIEADGATLVLSGDTTYCPGIVEAARGADLLVIEASFPTAAQGPGPHLTAAEAGQVAREAGARSVVLTHQYPQCDEHDMAALAGREFDGPIRVAEDLLALDVAGP
jgi:ribonuclease BN (tRNA processing enzyme)